MNFIARPEIVYGMGLSGNELLQKKPLCTTEKCSGKELR